MSYLVHLQQFEGPLGLLLYLIRKEEMDIFDINVNEITSKYLEYIRSMKELDLELAGEFVAMAATLIHIKSRMLLPQYNEEGDVVETEDPRKELVQKLLEYQKYQDAAKQLYARPLLNRDVFPRGLRQNYIGDDADVEIIVDEDGLFGLIAAYRRSLKKAHKTLHKVRPKVQSIANRVMEMKHRLIVGTRVLLRDLLQIGMETTSPRTQLLVTFLSILELGRMGFVSVFQSEIYGDIHIETKMPIERNVLERVQEFESGDAESVANSIISEAIEEKIDLAEAMANEEASEEPQQLSLVGEEAVARSDAEAFLEPVEIASDDEILAAELELEGAAGAPILTIVDPVAEESIEAAGEPTATVAVNEASDTTESAHASPNEEMASIDEYENATPASLAAETDLAMTQMDEPKIDEPTPKPAHDPEPPKEDHGSGEAQV